MPAKFQTTQSPESQTDNMGERMQAESLRIAFAVVGKMIGEDFIKIDFSSGEWPSEFQMLVQTVAEVLYDYQ